MKLLLTSIGASSEVVSEFVRERIIPMFSTVPSVLYISANDKPIHQMYIDNELSYLAKAGLTDIDALALRTDSEVPDKTYDVIHFCGGNTFDYLDRIRKSGLDKYIKDSVKSGKSIFIGVSAGSLIAGPDIEAAGWEDADENNVGMTDFTALGLVDFVTFPHLKPENIDRVIEGCRNKRPELNFVGITDNQAIWVDTEKSSEAELIG